MQITEAQAHVEREMRRGTSFEAIEDEINAMRFINDDQKSALWLLAWSYVNWRRQRRFARAAVAGLDAMTLELTTNTRHKR